MGMMEKPAGAKNSQKKEKHRKHDDKIFNLHE